jgi:hypothetical protein
MDTIHVSRKVKDQLKIQLLRKENKEGRNVTYDEVIRDLLRSVVH